MDHFVLEENLSNYAHVFLDDGATTSEMAAEGCLLEYKLRKATIASPSGYALVAFLGARSFGGGKHWLGVHVCGVVFCSERGSFESCGKKPRRSEGAFDRYLPEKARTNHDGISSWRRDVFSHQPSTKELCSIACCHDTPVRRGRVQIWPRRAPKHFKGRSDQTVLKPVLSEPLCSRRKSRLASLKIPFRLKVKLAQDF